MDYQTLRVQREGALMVVGFNRSEKKNAINRQVHLELQAVCRTLADDFETRVVILTGEGGVFSSGADTSEWRDSASNNELEVRNTSGIGSRTSAAIEGLDQPTRHAAPPPFSDQRTWISYFLPAVRFTVPTTSWYG